MAVLLLFISETQYCQNSKVNILNIKNNSSTSNSLRRTTVIFIDSYESQKLFFTVFVVRHKLCQAFIRQLVLNHLAEHLSGNSSNLAACKHNLIHML